MDSFGVGGSNAGQGIPASLGAIGTVLNFIGNMGAASASERAGERSRVAAELEAAQLRQNAGQAVAGSQREALTERRKAELLVSRGLAVAAASGGGASDPTVTKLLTDITGEGSYRAALALYAGEERKRQMEFGAEARRYEGEVAVEAGRSRAQAYSTLGFGRLATNAAGLYTRYGQGGPKKTDIMTGAVDNWDLLGQH